MEEQEDDLKECSWIMYGCIFSLLNAKATNRRTRSEAFQYFHNVNVKSVLLWKVEGNLVYLKADTEPSQLS